MPPAGLPRPDQATAASFSTWLEGALDAEAVAHPDPGRPTMHRLNRAEYSNAVRDIFALDMTPARCFRSTTRVMDSTTSARFFRFRRRCSTDIFRWPGRFRGWRWVISL